MEHQNDLFSHSYNNIKKIGDNRMSMLLLIALGSLYSCYTVYYLSENITDLFSNDYFKFIIFIIISIIASANPGLGVILAICVLVTLQVITNNKLKNENCTENFSKINIYNDNEYRDEYLTNPLAMQNQQSPIISNLNLKLETPTEMYKNMIKNGKILLDDSLELKNDLKTRYDVREQEIADITNRDGNVLVQSGINRLQKADEGEYDGSLFQRDSNLNFENNKNTFTKFDKLVNNYSDDHTVIQLFNDLKSKFEELSYNYEINPSDFENKINNIYDIEFELLATIYDIKQDTLGPEQKNIIINKIKQIKLMKQNNTPEQSSKEIQSGYYQQINNLLELLCI